MDARQNAIDNVLIVGGGIVGWSAAAALRRQMPWLTVEIVPQSTGASLADMMPCALPSIIGFHGDLGLSEPDAVGRTGCSYRLGSRFSGWADDRPDYYHTYGPHGLPLGAISFHLHWARIAANDAASAFHDYAPAAVLSQAGRFAPSFDPGDGLFGGFEYGLQLEVDRYRNMMRAFALHCGARERFGCVQSVSLRDDGFIGHVKLADGQSCSADLFLDCSGPDAALRTVMDDDREDWTTQLLIDRVLIAEGPPAPNLPLHDNVTATSTGWRWQAATASRTLSGVCYASTFCDDATAEAELIAGGKATLAAPPIAIAAGARRQPWLKNCVAIGDAAVSIEPLEWSNLHLAHSAIDRIIAMMPAKDCAPIELAEFNRQSRAEAIRVRDFVLLHYAASSRSEPFWRTAAAVDLPPSLAHSLALFRERGRLPVYEEETFARDSWLAVLFGQGILPRRIDALTEAVPLTEVTAAMTRLRNKIDASVSKYPKYADYLAAQTRQFAQ